MSTHIPDSLLPDMDNQSDESLLPTTLFIVGMSIGIVLGVLICNAFLK